MIFSVNLSASEKELIINRLIEIDNFTFNFEQISNEQKENGKCILIFNNRLKCKYNDEKQKEILINNRTLVVIHKRYNKKYFFPVNKSPLIKILNKDKLIQVINDSEISINDNITLTYQSNGEVAVFFDKKSYEFLGWKIKDNFQNETFFSLKIESINDIYDPKIFKIPSIN
tara:strand:- start:467 stop:982 length:516 start_codon:yes stop_codon:yes gene_type:complete